MPAPWQSQRYITAVKAQLIRPFPPNLSKTTGNPDFIYWGHIRFGWQNPGVFGLFGADPVIYWGKPHYLDSEYSIVFPEHEFPIAFTLIGKPGVTGVARAMTTSPIDGSPGFKIGTDLASAIIGRIKQQKVGE